MRQSLRVGLPLLPLVTFTLAWALFVYLDVRFDFDSKIIDTQLVPLTIVTVTFIATWLLSRVTFKPEGLMKEIVLGISALAITIVWLVLSVVAVIQFHLSIGGTL
jgi:hypothetical protein